MDPNTSQQMTGNDLANYRNVSVFFEKVYGKFYFKETLTEKSQALNL